MMKNQNSPFFAQRYLMVALETWWHFLLKLFLNLQKLKNRYRTTCLYKHPE